MSALQIRPIDVKYLAQYEAWFDHNPANTLLKLSKTTGSAGHSSRAWAGLLNDVVVAIALLSVDEMNHGVLDFAVKQSERRHGYGEEMMHRILVLTQLKDLLSVRVEVEPANTAAQKILHNTGFVQAGYSPDGLLEFVKRV